MLFKGLEIVLYRVVDAEVDHVETGTFQHHRHKVLSDVVDIALDRADNH